MTGAAEDPGGSVPVGGWAEDTAGWWQREFTDGVDPEYTEQIIPIVMNQLGRDRIGPSARILDVGTGEGQVARALRSGGADVIGIDPISAMVSEAAQRDPDMPIAQAGAAALPFAAASFDAALACLVFEHIDDLDRAIADVARVLRPGGTFLFLLNHPLLQTPDSGWIDDQIVEPPEQYWRIGPYLIEQATIEEVQKDVFIRFIHRPLSRYLNSLAERGMTLAEMHEPAPPEGFLAQAPQFRDAATVPRLLVLRLVKAAPSS
jgi:ubiquinone/menaquinone biosynthesis C-methylase UbiE